MTISCKAPAKLTIFLGRVDRENPCVKMYHQTGVGIIQAEHLFRTGKAGPRVANITPGTRRSNR